MLQIATSVRSLTVSRNFDVNLGANNHKFLWSRWMQTSYSHYIKRCAFGALKLSENQRRSNQYSKAGATRFTGAHCYQLVVTAGLSL
jgi:D-alanyl-lipoteichoic acid acyltransferase DltB (MBOAT superfamily)